MRSTEILPIIAAVALVAFTLAVALGIRVPGRHLWILPAALSGIFLALSLAAVITEGPLGFWTEHTRNLWGNQLWCDLLLAVGVSWFLAAPETRRLKMPLLPWLALVLGTGSIGLLAMISRLLWLRERSAG